MKPKYGTVYMKMPRTCGDDPALNQRADNATVNAPHLRG